MQPPPLVIPASDVQLAEMRVGLESDDEDEEGDAEGDETAAAKAPGRSKKTKKDRAREGRRRAQEDAVAEKKALKALRRDLTQLKDLQQGISDQDAQTLLQQQRLKVPRSLLLCLWCCVFL